MKRHHFLLVLFFIGGLIVYSQDKTPDAVELNKQASQLFYKFPDSAIALANQARDFAQNANDRTEVGTSIRVIGNVHYVRGDYSNALSSYIESFAVFQEIGDTVKMAGVLSSQGLVYKNIGDYDQALERYNYALELVKDIEDDAIKSKILNNTGVVHRYLKDYEKALFFYQQSLEYKTKLGDKKGIANTLTNLGIISNEKGDHRGAIDYFLKSLELEKELGYDEGIAKNLNNIANSYSYIPDFTQVINYATQGLEIGERLGTKIQIKEASGLLAKAYENQGDFRKAHEFSKLFHSTKDSLFNEDVSREIGRLESKLELEKKEAEIKILDQQKQIAESELANKRIIQLLLFVTLILVVLGTFLVLRSHRQKSKLKEEILNSHINELRARLNILLGKYEGQFDLEHDELNKELVNPISEREFDVLRMIFNQKTNQEIAQELFISINTVKTHLKNLYDKLGVSNRGEAVELLAKKG